MGGSKETTNTSSQQNTNYSSTSSPLDWQSSALQNAFGEANALNGYDATSSQPDFNTYTGLNNTEKSAFNQMPQRARITSTQARPCWASHIPAQMP